RLGPLHGLAEFGCQPGIRGVLLRWPNACLGQHQPAFVEFDTHILTGLDATPEIALPGCERITPGFDVEAVTPRLGRHEPPVPAVVLMMKHRGGPGGRVALATPDEACQRHLRAITEDIRPDTDRLAGDPLRRETAAVDLRINIFDDILRR